MYRPTSLYAVWPFARPAISASVRADISHVPSCQHLDIPMHTSISPSRSLTCISPVPPGHSTSSNVDPASRSASCSKGERKCSRCQPTLSLEGIVAMHAIQHQRHCQEVQPPLCRIRPTFESPLTRKRLRNEGAQGGFEEFSTPNDRECLVLRSHVYLQPELTTLTCRYQQRTFILHEPDNPIIDRLRRVMIQGVGWCSHVSGPSDCQLRGYKAT